MSSNLLSQIAAKKGGPAVTLNDFVSCGQLHATKIGLARCQSEPLAVALRIIGQDLRKKCSRAQVLGYSNEMFTIALLMVCSNAEWKTSMSEDEGEEFLAKNRDPLSRLILAAYLATLPPVPAFGIARSQITQRSIGWTPTER